MKLEALKENTDFFKKAFREDIQRLGKLPQEKVNEVTEFLLSLEDYQQLNDEEKWTDLSASFEEPLDEVLKYLRPIQFIAHVATDEKCSAKDVVSGLCELGVIPSDWSTTFLALCDPVHKLIVKAKEKVAPRLPLLKLKSISTRCFLISEFDEEFSTEKHDPAKYAPGISRLYPASTIRLSFYGDNQSPIGIQMSNNDLDTLIKWLQLTRVQVKKLESFSKERDLPVILGDEQ